MKKIKVTGLNKHCSRLFEKLKDAKRRPYCDSFWLNRYTNAYKKAKEIKEKIKSLASNIKDEGVSDKKYIIQINTLEEYFDLYNLLKSIPNSEIKIYSPSLFYVDKEDDTFYQVD